MGMPSFAVLELFQSSGTVRVYAQLTKVDRILGFLSYCVLDALKDVLIVFHFFPVKVLGLKKKAPPKPPRPSQLRKKNLAANQPKR